MRVTYKRKIFEIELELGAHSGGTLTALSNPNDCFDNHILYLLSAIAWLPALTAVSPSHYRSLARTALGGSTKLSNNGALVTKTSR